MAYRPTSPSSAPLCPTAASRWQSRPAPPTATSPLPSCTRSLPTTPAPHNQAVFDAYTPEMKKARHTHIITGLPDTYGRGRIVGDYRRVALYGIDALIQFKQEDLANCGDGTMTDDVIRLREEIARQISALKGMKKMAEAYGYDISQPAKTPKGGLPVAVLRLSGRHQDPERRRHERGPHLHLPGYLYPARSGQGHP